jgi:TonB family protein
MSANRIHAPTVIAVACWLAASGSVYGQETLTRAKDLYASAAYEEALAVIDRLHDTAPVEETSEVAGYRIFCLLALDRTDEARREIQSLVRANPLYRLSGAQASPRTRALFDEERRRLLPEIVQQTYSTAKAALDRKEFAAALSGFDRMLVILDEPGVTNQAGLEDMRTLATGFRDLIKLSIATAAAARGTSAAPSAPPAAAPASSARNAAPAVYTLMDADVVPPVAINQVAPAWNPQGATDDRPRRALLELVIDETGSVTSAVLKNTLHPSYDQFLLRAARRWKFHAATRNGVPVRYRKLIEIVLTPKA